MIYLLIPYMAAIYRLRGHSLNIRPFGQVLYALPFAAFTYFDAGWIAAAIVLVLTTITVLKGHGHNMDLGTYDKPADYEWYEKVTGYRKLHGKISEYWYDVGGMALSGLTYSIPAGIATLNPLIAISGATKAIAYMISWKLFKNTEGGEWLTGALQGLCLALLWSDGWPI